MATVVADEAPPRAWPRTSAPRWRQELLRSLPPNSILFWKMVVFFLVLVMLNN